MGSTVLKDFKILIGIPIYGYLYYSQFHGMNYSFKFYQLLAYFLQPFGKIGFVPVIDCSPSSFEPAILPLPNSYIAEVAEPERLVIQGESILNLIINEQISSNSQKVDVSVFYHYWDETPKCSFNDFVLNKYSEQIKEIKR